MLNYYGWSDEKALQFWQQHSKGLDDIARREIARMRRWPAQVITYKYGAETILRWQKAAAKKKDFDWVDFHTKVLQPRGTGEQRFTMSSTLIMVGFGGI
ncbi:MAG: DUF885 family protein [Lewinella sp.]